MINRPHPGSKYRFSSRFLNSAIDAARAVDRHRNDTRVTPVPRIQSSGIVWIRNDSGADREQFDVLGIGTALITPADNEFEWANQPSLSGAAVTANHMGRFGILLEPLRDGAVGRACIIGLCPARVYMNSELDRFADVSEGEALLHSSASGAAQLLYVEEPGDRESPMIARCIVRIGGAGAAPLATMALVTSKTGFEPPFYYSAEQAMPDGLGGWEAIMGGIAWSNTLYNVQEQGTAGIGACSIPEGSLVAVQGDGYGGWMFSASTNRGTY